MCKKNYIKKLFLEKKIVNLFFLKNFCLDSFFFFENSNIILNSISKENCFFFLKFFNYFTINLKFFFMVFFLIKKKNFIKNSFNQIFYKLKAFVVILHKRHKRNMFDRNLFLFYKIKEIFNQKKKWKNISKISKNLSFFFFFEKNSFFVISKTYLKKKILFKPFLDKKKYKKKIFFFIKSIELLELSFFYFIFYLAYFKKIFFLKGKKKNKKNYINNLYFVKKILMTTKKTRNSFFFFLNFFRIILEKEGDLPLFSIITIFLKVKFFDFFFFNTLNLIVKILQERSRIQLNHSFSKKIFNKRTFIDETFFYKNQNNYILLKKTLKNFLLFFSFFRRKNKRFFKKVLNLWKTLEVKFFLNDEIINNFLFCLPDFVVELCKKLNFFFLKQLILKYSIGHHSTRKKKFYFLKHFLNFHQKSSLFFKQIFLLETEPRSFYRLLFSIKNFSLKLDKEVFKFTINKEGIKIILFLLIGSIKTKFNLLLPYFQNIQFILNKILTKKKNYPANHLFLCLSNLILLNNIARKILNKKKNFPSKKIKIKKKWFCFFFKICEIFLNIKKEIYSKKKFRKKNYKIFKETKIRKKKKTIKIVQNSLDFFILEKNQKKLYAVMPSTDKKRILLFISFVKQLINKNEKSWSKTIQPYFFPSSKLNFIISLFGKKKKKAQEIFLIKKIGCCIDCYFLLFKSDFLIFKSGKKKKKKKWYRNFPDTKMFFLSKSLQLQVLLYHSFFFFYFLKLKILQICKKIKELFFKKIFRRKPFSFFFKNWVHIISEKKKFCNSSKMVVFLFFQNNVEMYYYYFSKKNFTNFYKITKRKIFWVQKEKDPIIEKFIHNEKKKKTKNFKMKIEVKKKKFHFFHQKNSFFIIFLTKFFSNLNVTRLFLNEIRIKKNFLPKIKRKNLTLANSNINYSLPLSYFFKKKKIQKNIGEKNERLYFLCKYFLNNLSLFKIDLFFSIVKNNCAIRSNILLFILKDIACTLLKQKKIFNIKEVFQIFNTIKDFFFMKFFLYFLKNFVIYNYYRNFKTKTNFLNFFLSSNWFLMRKKKKNSYNISEKKNYLLLNDLIKKNTKGDLIVINLFLNFEFLISQKIGKKFFYNNLEIFFKNFSFSKTIIRFRKNLINKNFLKISKNFIKRKILFFFNKNIYLFFFLKYFWIKKKIFINFFLKKYKKKKKTITLKSKNFSFFSIIGKILESGFFGKKLKKFILTIEIQIIIMLTKFFSAETMTKKTFEFFNFFVKFFPLKYLMKLFYLINNFIKITNLLKKNLLGIISCFLFQIPYILKINYKNFSKKNELKIIKKMKTLSLILIIPQMVINSKNQNLTENLFFFEYLNLYSIFNYVFSKTSVGSYLFLFFYIFNKKCMVRQKFKKIFPKIAFNFGIRTTTKENWVWKLRKNYPFLIQKFYLLNFPYFFKGFFLNKSLNIVELFSILKKTLCFFLKFFEKYFLNLKLGKNFDFNNSFLISLIKTVILSAFFFFYFFDYFWENFFLNLISIGFFKIPKLKNFFFDQILPKISMQKHKKKNMTVFCKKKISLLCLNYNTKMLRQSSENLLFEQNIQSLYNFIFLFLLKLHKKNDENSIRFFYDIFLNNFFYGNKIYSNNLFLNIYIFVKTANFYIFKYRLYFFHVCYSKIFFLFKTNNKNLLNHIQNVSDNFFDLFVKLPTFIIFKEIKSLKLIVLILKNGLLSYNKIKQLIVLKILKKFTIANVFPFDFLNLILSSIFIYLKATIHEIKNCSNFIFLQYFSKTKPDYRIFKIGLILLLRCIPMKNLNLKLIFFEIFVNILFNSSKKLLNMFSKIIFPKLFFNLFMDLEKICSYSSGLIMNVYCVLIDKKNFLHQLIKIDKKKKGKWFVVRINLFWKLICFSLGKKQGLFQVEYIFQFIIHFSTIYHVFQNKEWDLFYFSNLIYNQILYESKWINGILLLYKLPWHRFFQKNCFNFSWVENRKIKFITNFFFNQFDINILLLVRWARKIFRHLLNILKKKKDNCFDFMKNKCQLLYQIFFISNFYPIFEKKNIFFLKRKKNFNPISFFNNKIKNLYSSIYYFQLSFRKSFLIATHKKFFAIFQFNLYNLKNPVEKFLKKKIKKELYFLTTILHCLKKLI